MLRRLLIVAGIALVLVLGARFALGELAERAWEKRRAELATLALPPETLRRPWEVRYEALEQVLATSERFRAIVDSTHRPEVAWGGESPRPLDEFEELWVAAAAEELTGLESILRELRGLPLDELVWHGDAVRLSFLREAVDFLCARAWLAAGHGDDAAAARGYADALRLAEATDERSLIGTILRYACQVNLALVSARAALELGLSAQALREATEPLLAGWAYAPARAELGVRVEITAFLEAAGDGTPDDPLAALRYFGTIDEALALARGPLESTPWAQPILPKAADASGLAPLVQWTTGVRQLHAFHSAGNVALTALAVAAHREEHGAWPATLGELDDLPVEQALDPLTRAPLPYALTPDGARLGPAAWVERVEGGDDVDQLPFVWTLR